MPYTSIHHLQEGGTVEVDVVPSGESNFSLYHAKITNDSGSAHEFRIKQKRHSNSFEDKSVIPADQNVEFGSGNPEHSILNFNAGGTIEVAMQDQSGTISATLNFET